MAKHLGNLVVTKENIHSFPAVAEIYGHLTIDRGTHLIAPKLTLVRGWITFYGTNSGEYATLDAPMLGKVDGWVTMHPNSRMTAINLRTIINDLSLGEGAIFEAPLASVGAINMSEATDITLPSLTEVREGVTLRNGARVAAPALERIGKSVTLREGARLDAPLLNYIGGYADIDESASLKAPKFIS